MGDEKASYEALPIPSYEEATSNRPTSSQSRLGPEETSDDAERQTLLNNRDDAHHGPTTTYPSGYHPPTVESARSSLDFLPSSNGSSARGSTEELRQELNEMDVEEPGESSGSQRPHLGQRLSKRFPSLSRTLSSIHLPLRKYLPKFNFSLRGFSRSQAGPLLENHGCTLALRMVGLFIIMSVVYLLFASDMFTLGAQNMGQMYDPESVRIFVQSHINETSIEDYLRIVTEYPHIAGTSGNYALAEYVEQQFLAAGLEHVGLERFDVYLNYPKEDGRRVAIVDPPELAWEATIEEEQVYGDSREQTLVFHGLSKSGNVTGPLVYANYGSREDFKLLADKGISLNGSIALIRYYGSQGDRSLKVKAAELEGAVGCILYSDPAEDGFRQGDEWPDGRYMPADGVQRGSVSLMSWVVGDVLSPGFASLPDEKKRISPEDSNGLNKIPSIPIAWRDAQNLLQALKSHGQKVPKDWVGGVPGIGEWWTGDLSSPKVNLMNIQDEVTRQPIYNVLGRITGIEQHEKKIIIGSHRDAWCFGAADPGSGTSVLLEVIRVFGELRSLGWRPLRTIEFASWDGEEYNLIGSTEHVEDNVDELRRNAFAYLNVDVAVSGTNFQASASPIFETALMRVLDRTSDPITNETLRHIWDYTGSKLEGLGAGSDYVAFQDIAGTSSIDFGFQGDEYPYHSCYDSFDWMANFGDPGFQYHKVLGQIWALLTLELSDRPILPFDMKAYATAVQQYVDDLDKYAKANGAPLSGKSARGNKNSRPGNRKPVVDLKPLHRAAKVFTANAMKFRKWSDVWKETVYGSGGLESNVMAIERMSHNSHMGDFETHVLDLEEGGGVSTHWSLVLTSRAVY